MPNGIITILDETDKPTITTVTLPSSSWNINTLTQSVTVTGVLEDITKQIINVSPVGASIIVAANSVVYCSGQAADSLIFTCSEIPTEDIIYNVSIQDATYTG